MKLTKEEKQELKRDKKAWNKMIRLAKKKNALIEGDLIKSIYKN